MIAEAGPPGEIRIPNTGFTEEEKHSRIQSLFSKVEVPNKVIECMHTQKCTAHCRILLKYSTPATRRTTAIQMLRPTSGQSDLHCTHTLNWLVQAPTRSCKFNQFQADTEISMSIRVVREDGTFLTGPLNITDHI